MHSGTLLAAWRPFAMSVVVIAALAGGGAATAQTVPTEPATPIAELVSGIVRIKALINPDGRTVGTLGAERSGTGIVIDGDGLVLTIGYLMVEAHAGEVELNDGRRVAAEVVGYDHDTGFGLLRATSALNVRPVPLGRSADVKVGDRVLVALAGGIERVGPANIAAKREFAGYWEYLLDEALFTTPPYQDWSGAALVNRDGRLVGVGSLVVGDTSGIGTGPPGNMFVPVDLLPPILAELIASGKPSGPARPWIGLTTDEKGGGLVVRRVTEKGPAETAGLLAGDRIVGVGDARPRQLGDLYRSIWGLGQAGVNVPLEIERDGKRQRFDVKSIDRRQHLRLNSSL